MRARRFVLPIAALALVGCDRITGADQQKILDAEAIGYACRISIKTPEDCMKENEIYSPTSVLYGWKEADKDIQAKTIDPSMGKNQPASQPQQSAPPDAESGSKSQTGKVDGKAAPTTGESPATAKSGKPAEAAGKPAQGVAEKKTGH